MSLTSTAQKGGQQPAKPASTWRELVFLPLLGLMVAGQFALAFGAGPQAAWLFLEMALGLPDAGEERRIESALLHPLPKLKPDLSAVVPISLPPSSGPITPVNLEVWGVSGAADLGPNVSLVHDVDALNRKFSALGYELGKVRSGTVLVPRAYLQALPKDLPDIQSAKVRKNAFIKLMLPLILKANAKVETQRRRYLSISQQLERGGEPSQDDSRWLKQLSKTYDVDLGGGENLLSALPKLERRIDVIPPSLAIAQSAEESGWGTSRFAVQGNAVYGQWSWRKGSGIVPLNRDDGQSHEVRAFRSLQNSVDAYVRNLNTHWAYKTFREKRAALRKAGQSIDSGDLVETLTSYSERGLEYVETLRTIIRVNRLEDLDTARLHTGDSGDTRL